MLDRLARAYVVLLLGLGVLTLLSGLVLHAFSFFTSGRTITFCAEAYFKAVIVVILPAFAFMKDGLRWKDQVKSCPEWMWKAALGLWAYGFVVFILKVVFPAAPSPIGDPMVVSSFPLGFDAITICILYAAFGRRWLNEAELKRAAAISVVIIGVELAIFGGFLPAHVPGVAR